MCELLAILLDSADLGENIHYLNSHTTKRKIAILISSVKETCMMLSDIWRFVWLI